MNVTEKYNQKIYKTLNEQSLLGAIIKIFLPKNVRYSVDQVHKMKREDPELQVTIDAIDKSGKKLADLIRTFKERYPQYIEKGK